MSVQRAISESINASRIGRTVEVIIDGAARASAAGEFLWEGRTRWDAPEVDGKVYVKGSSVREGDIARVRIQGADEYDLFGECP